MNYVEYEDNSEKNSEKNLEETSEGTSEETNNKSSITKTANTVKKKVADKNINLFKNIFRYNRFIKFMKSKFSINVISILFLLLIMLHLSFGYSFTTTRLLLFVSFVSSLGIIYILYKLVFEDILNSNKYQTFNNIYPIFIFMLFIALIIVIYLGVLLPILPNKLRYKFPV
jgi:hypothetical protein